ncbi:hypothetical protein GCM10027294_52670 [Marinactinospora endophytica]
MVLLTRCRRPHPRYERETEHSLAFTNIACTPIYYTDSPNEMTSKDRWPARLPRRARLRTWSARSGVVCVMPLRRSQERIALEL